MRIITFRRLSIAISLVLVATAGVSAFELGAGLQMGLGLSTISSPNLDEELADDGTIRRSLSTGFVAGGQVRSHFGDIFGAQLDVVYSLMGGGYRYEVTIDDEEFDLHNQTRFHSIRTPVSVMARIPIGEQNRLVPSVGAGPEFFLAAQNRVRFEGDEPDDDDISQEDWESINADFGNAASFVIGLDFETNLEGAEGVGTVGVRYVRQFDSFGPETDDSDDEIRQSSLQLLATFTPMFIN